MTFVKINPSRGYGDDLHEVIRTRGEGLSKTYKLKNTKTGDTFDLFATHCYENFETKKASFLERRTRAQTMIERAKTIGQNKRSTKRK